MAAREAIKIVADALETNLQTKLDAMSVVSGETVPVIADFRDAFSDDIPENPRDWPMVATLVDPITAEGEMERFAKADIRVPMIVLYASFDRDKAQAMQRAAYAYRGIAQVLNDVAQQTTNGVQLVQLLDPRPVWGEPEEGPGVLLAIRFTAQMRDTAP